MHHLSSLIATTISFFILVNGDCSTFTPSTAYSVGFSAPVAASTVSECDNGNLINGQPASDFQCSVTGPMQQSCALGTSGDITVYGRTNLSLSTTDAASLYRLLPLYNETETNPLVHAVPAQSMCVNVNNAGGSCIASGQISYLTYAQKLVCISGTFSGCDNGPVSDNTSAEMCGVVDRALDIEVRNVSSLAFNNGYSTSNQCTPNGGIALRPTTVTAVCIAAVITGLIGGML